MAPQKLAHEKLISASVRWYEQLYYKKMVLHADADPDAQAAANENSYTLQTVPNNRIDVLALYDLKLNLEVQNLSADAEKVSLLLQKYDFLARFTDKIGLARAFLGAFEALLG